MLELARAIFGGGRSEDERAHDALVELATERAIQGTDPRLVAISGYKKQLREPVERAIEFVQGLTPKLTQPLEVHRAAYASDASVHAFFGSTEQIQEIFSLSPSLREFLEEPENLLLTHVFAGLAMQRAEKKVFTPQLVNGVMQRDVPGMTINFSEHRIVIPAASEEDLHREFEERTFMTLVECALERLASIQDRKKDLERERALLRTKLRGLKKRALGMEPLLAGEHVAAGSIPAIEAELDAAEAELQTTAAGIGTLEQHLEQVKRVLGNPQEHVQLEQATTRITPMGFAAREGSSEPVAEVSYAEIHVAGSPSFVGRLVRYPREEMLPIEKFRPVL